MDKSIKIAAGLFIVVALVCAIFLVIPQQIEKTPVSGIESSMQGMVTVYFFYGDECPHCHNVMPFMESLKEKYPDVDIQILETYHNRTNQVLSVSLNQKLGAGNPGVPEAIIGNVVLVGERDIPANLEAAIIGELKKKTVSDGQVSQKVIPEKDSSFSPEFPQLSLVLVIVAAIVDSANPCGLSVLVFLLVPMAAAGSRKRILLVGSAYIAATFLFHLFVGIGLFSVFSFSGLSRMFALIGGSVALILGIITIADVLRNRETFILSIPESKKGMLGNYIRIASLPAAFILGILAGVLGFSCTGGIYISILALLGQEMTVMTGLPWLVLYNFIYVLPLILITFLVAYGISPGQADSMREKYKRTIRMVIGVVLVSLGAIILLGWMG
ncbi:MAG: cytochrome c biogenesis protein [Methanoregula sp.]|nr:cytochrome c biogenesis protein [Methanoregula sp.]